MTTQHIHYYLKTGLIVLCCWCMVLQTVMAADQAMTLPKSAKNGFEATIGSTCDNTQGLIHSGVTSKYGFSYSEIQKSVIENGSQYFVSGNITLDFTQPLVLSQYDIIALNETIVIKSSQSLIKNRQSMTFRLYYYSNEISGLQYTSKGVILTFLSTNIMNSLVNVTQFTVINTTIIDESVVIVNPQMVNYTVRLRCPFTAHFTDYTPERTPISFYWVVLIGLVICISGVVFPNRH